MKFHLGFTRRNYFSAMEKGIVQKICHIKCRYYTDFHVGTYQVCMMYRISPVILFACLKRIRNYIPTYEYL